MTTERARLTAGQIMDHLYSEGFRDDTGMLYVHTAETYDGKVLVSLYPHDYDCETCRTRGFLPKLVEAFKQRLRPTWCADCLALTDQRWDRLGALSPVLKAALERGFAVTEVSPGSPFTSFVIVP